MHKIRKLHIKQLQYLSFIAFVNFFKMLTVQLILAHLPDVNIKSIKTTSNMIYLSMTII